MASIQPLHLSSDSTVTVRETDLMCAGALAWCRRRKQVKHPGAILVGVATRTVCMTGRGRMSFSHQGAQGLLTPPSADCARSPRAPFLPPFVAVADRKYSTDRATHRGLYLAWAILNIASKSRVAHRIHDLRGLPGRGQQPRCLRGDLHGRPGVLAGRGRPRRRGGARAAAAGAAAHGQARGQHVQDAPAADGSSSSTLSDSLILSATDEAAKKLWVKNIKFWNRYGWRDTVQVAATHDDLVKLQETLQNYSTPQLLAAAASSRPAPRDVKLDDGSTARPCLARSRRHREDFATQGFTTPPGPPEAAWAFNDFGQNVLRSRLVQHQRAGDDAITHEHHNGGQHATHNSLRRDISVSNSRHGHHRPVQADRDVGEVMAVTLDEVHGASNYENHREERHQEHRDAPLVRLDVVTQRRACIHEPSESQQPEHAHHSENSQHSQMQQRSRVRQDEAQVRRYQRAYIHEAHQAQGEPAGVAQ
ncbi:hypothetical protein ON010_g7355 [Phytophthora cinnamomi]|nr:hypothetical protein ON010_g7355 [Phytophthora cinnamomi]